MTIEVLPFEIISNIAKYLSRESVGTLARTCKHCYHAVFPYIWQTLALHHPKHILSLSQRLHANAGWVEHAHRYVRFVSVGHKRHYISPYTVSNLLDEVLSGWETLDIQEEAYSNTTSLHLDWFTDHLFSLFPNASTLRLDCEMTKSFLQWGLDSDSKRIAFPGSLTLVHYRPSSTGFLSAILSKFHGVRSLALQTRPYLSLCAAMQESILSDVDLNVLATSDLVDLETLQLSFVDDIVGLDSFDLLVRRLPHLQNLSLEWLLPPTTVYFNQLCDILLTRLNLHPQPVKRSSTCYCVTFTPYLNPELPRRYSALE